VQEWYNQKDGREQADIVLISPCNPDAAGVNFSLIQGGRITGNVKDGQGNLLDDVRVDIIDGSENYYLSVYSDSNGVFNSENVYPGLYTLRFFSPQHKYLVIKIPGVSVAAGETTDVGTVILTAGDANGDNTVNIFDLVLLAKSYGRAQGQPGYNNYCDFNGDTVIDFKDLIILAKSYDMSGD
jgi:hypothetical protein